MSECQQCSEGSYCNAEGLSAPVGLCPGGYYCPLGTADPYTYPCPAGFYRSGSAAGSFQDCTTCKSGHYCDKEGLEIPIECPAGHFCVEGTTEPSRCPLGTYGNSTKVRKSTECTPCPGGQYCDGIGRTEPAGLCDAGFYCREAAYTSAPPDGITGGVCPAGGFCPAGSAVGSACPAGYYSPSPGAKYATDCVPCDPGYFCAGSSSATATQPCAAGYYCTGGSPNATQHETQKGHYSKEGFFKQEPCQRGTYQPSPRSSECLVCPQGYYCNDTGAEDNIICPRGNYCPTGSEIPTPCPEGTFGKEVGRYEVSHCSPCTEGYACEIVGLEAPSSPCHAGHYCRPGANHSTPIEETFGDLCPAGYYCVEGTKAFEHTPCPNGTYSNITGMCRSLRQNFYNKSLQYV